MAGMSQLQINPGLFMPVLNSLKAFKLSPFVLSPHNPGTNSGFVVLCSLLRQ
jgi:hypothetical protein